MATNITIGGDGALFVGEDKSLVLHVLDTDGVPVNISGWTITFAVRERLDAPQVITKTATVSGTYSATLASNTQRATVTLAAADTLTWAAKTYQHAWKRTDSGSATVLAYGSLVVEQPTQW